MKKNVICCLLIYIIWSNLAFSQALDSSLDRIDSYVSEVDRIRRGPYISEGSIKTKDGKGIGGFSDYFYNHPETKKIIKVTSGKTIHYGYESKKVKKPITERIQTEFYYRNDSLVFAKILEEYYDTVKVFYAKETILKLNDFNEELFTSNPFQKEFVKWILNLSEGYRKKYYEDMKLEGELFKLSTGK